MAVQVPLLSSALADQNAQCVAPNDWALCFQRPIAAPRHPDITFRCSYALIYLMTRRMIEPPRNGDFDSSLRRVMPHLGLELLEKNLERDDGGFFLFFCTCFTFHLDLYTYPLRPMPPSKAHQRGGVGREE